MQKDVMVAIKGLQFAQEDDADNIETFTRAEYYKRNNSHYVIYEEPGEGPSDGVKSVIKFREDYLDVTKKGMINVHMVFEENKKNMANYATPFGDILVGIDARDILLKEEEEAIDLKVNYALEVNYEHLADCQISMSIRPSGTNSLNLLS